MKAISARLLRWGSYYMELENAKRGFGCPSRKSLDGFLDEKLVVIGSSDKKGWEELRESLGRIIHDATVKEIVDHRYRFSGEAHQYEENCVPCFEVMFDDGSKADIWYCLSFRAWGSLMAEAWNEIEKTNKYDYMDFYMLGFMDTPENELKVEKHPQGSK